MARLRSTAATTIGFAACLLVGGLACTGGPDATYTLVDDMEGGTGVISWTPPVGFPGFWDSYTDVECDHVLPIPSYAGGTWTYDSVPTPYETRPGITSTHAARFRTTAPLDNTWGAGIGLDFALLTTAPSPSGIGCVPAADAYLMTPAVSVDLTAFKGVSFWGMADAAAGSTRVSFRLDDWNTDPHGGRCDPTMPNSPERSCFNSFHSFVDLTSTFTQYTIDFSELFQGEFGQPAMLDLKHSFQLSFEVDTRGGYCPPPTVCADSTPSLTFDIWIDDLYFVNR